MPRSSAFFNFCSHSSKARRPCFMFNCFLRTSSERALLRSSTVAYCWRRPFFASNCSLWVMDTWQRLSKSRNLTSAASTAGLVFAISSTASASSARARAISDNRAAACSSTSRWRRAPSSASSLTFDKASNFRSLSASKPASSSDATRRASSRRCISASASTARLRIAVTVLLDSRSFAEASVFRASNSLMRSCEDLHSRSAKTYSRVLLRPSRRSHSRSSRCSSSRATRRFSTSPINSSMRVRRIFVSSIIFTDSARLSS
mmetsp:Transcript_48842/g.77835  ORF Transcript_48842/g.77835 Transcript_48842/m.77835 type:complete len:261 (+) Transcript_48842:2292-3074(+)